VELSHLRADKCLYPALLAGAGNRACSLRGLGQSIETDRVAVGEAGFLAGLGAYANALIEVETAFLDDAILKNPGFRDLALEVQISGIDAGTCDFTQHGTEAVERQVTGRQQVLADGLQHRIHGHSTTTGRGASDKKNRRCCCTGIRWRMAAWSAASREASNAASP